VAKVKTSQLSVQAAPVERGVLNMRNTKHGVVMQKWPEGRGRGTTPYRWYSEQEFIYAARWATDVDALDRETAENLVKGSLYIWRDAIISATYGNFLRITDENGVLLQSSREVAQNPQLILDLVTTEVGAMLFRSSVGWIGITPGNVGQVLTMAANPEWQDAAGGGGGGGATIFAPAHLNPASLTTQSANYVQGTMATINPEDHPNCIQFYAGAAGATSQNTPAVYLRNGNQGGALLMTGPTITGVVQGINTLALDAEIDVADPTFVFVGIHTKVSSFTTPTHPGLPDWYVSAAGSLPNPAGTLTMGSNTALAAPWLARL
jgi:hypothetical protein